MDNYNGCMLLDNDIHYPNNYEFVPYDKEYRIEDDRRKRFQVIVNVVFITFFGSILIHIVKTLL